ncbi:GTPase ObgE [Candidatus Marinamargulisbacteria bacterium SCGC AAA071-K20]|nr:GTPase ObgE [Candidatus Marinamargulisbacteria bacterium SCGC AAA071-K20]
MSSFIDKVTVKVESGSGGQGCISFRREKYEPKGGPNGGDGGQGGSILFKVSTQVQSLSEFRHRKVHKAKSGDPGRTKQQSGLKGADIELKVPLGTLVYSAEGALIKDLNTPDSFYCAAEGGLGGKGNMNFATSINQTPRYAQPGKNGENRELKLELRMIAEVGLIGFPNAGKSTLLKTLTYSNPKIANYPFTTLSPNLGTLKLIDREIVIADIPGLIKGASKGLGLGDEFLRHIDRTGLLIHLVAVEEDVEKCIENYTSICGELDQSDYNLLAKPQIVALSKCDAVEDDIIKKIEKAFKKIKISTIKISSYNGDGIDTLMETMLTTLNEKKDEK